jgi:ubiquinone/menaquinone biosynthesis C-methylase UbiE
VISLKLDTKEIKMMDKDKFDPKHDRVLDSTERLNELKPGILLKEYGGIAPGMTCIDFGSGTGIFSIPMAEYAVEKGKVYAIDESTEMLAHIQSKNPHQTSDWYMVMSCKPGWITG